MGKIPTYLFVFNSTLLDLIWEEMETWGIWFPSQVGSEGAGADSLERKQSWISLGDMGPMGVQFSIIHSSEGSCSLLHPGSWLWHEAPQSVERLRYSSPWTEANTPQPSPLGPKCPKMPFPFLHSFFTDRKEKETHFYACVHFVICIISSNSQYMLTRQYSKFHLYGEAHLLRFHNQ